MRLPNFYRDYFA